MAGNFVYASPRTEFPCREWYDRLRFENRRAKIDSSQYFNVTVCDS
jgi:hypothetical protein